MFQDEDDLIFITRLIGSTPKIMTWHIMTMQTLSFTVNRAAFRVQRHIQNSVKNLTWRFL